MKVTVIPMIIRTLGTLPKNLEKNWGKRRSEEELR